MLHNVNRILHSYLESGENPEQAYPYCIADEGSKDYSSHWIVRSGKALPEEDAKSGYKFCRNYALGRSTGFYFHICIHFLIIP